MSNRLSRIAKRITGNGNGHIPIISAERRVRVLVAVPSRDEVKTIFASALAALFGYTAHEHPEIELRLIFNRGTLIASQRQSLAEHALKPDPERGITEPATHILWLDSDMHFPEDALVQLLRRRVPIVGANYPTRQPPIKPTAMRSDIHEVEVDGEKKRVAVSHDIFSTPDKSGLEEVSWMGFGVLLTETRVFEKLDKPWFFVEYRGTKEDGYFSGEDVFFCRHAKHSGFQILVDHDLSKQVQHVGEMAWGHGHISKERHEKAMEKQAQPLAGLVEILP